MSELDSVKGRIVKTEANLEKAQSYLEQAMTSGNEDLIVVFAKQVNEFAGLLRELQAEENHLMSSSGAGK